MAHQVLWSADKLEFFIANANLSARQEYIMRSRCKGATITEQALHEHTGTATISREILHLKKMYDEVQKANPDRLPPRKSSKAELYMDTH